MSEGIKLVLPSGQRNRTADCICECGNKTNVRLLHLTRGRTISCGCVSRIRGGKSKTYPYIVWNSIKTRIKQNYTDSHIYYEKGIGVCDEWKEDFLAFYKWAKKME